MKIVNCKCGFRFCRPTFQSRIESNRYVEYLDDMKYYRCPLCKTLNVHVAGFLLSPVIEKEITLEWS
jgi:hypothetical protein